MPPMPALSTYRETIAIKFYPLAPAREAGALYLGAQSGFSEPP